MYFLRCKKRKKSGWQSVHTAFWLAFLLCVGTLWPGAFAEAASDVQETTWQEEAAQGVEKDSCLKMHILDVGQGLSLLFESDGRYLLYDGGDRDYSSKVVSYLKEQGVRTLDMVVASHYDADHLNGVVGALNVFAVQQVMAPDYETDTRVYQSFVNILQEKEIPVTRPTVGETYALGSAAVTVLSPAGGDYADVNDYSVSLRITYGDISILVTGDATTLAEEEMISSGENLDSDILVAGHHGSESSSSEAFLQSVSPCVAVISCAANSRYHHPSRAVMERLKEAGIPVLRTDRQGDMVVSTDGAQIFYSTDPCTDYSDGESGAQQGEAAAEGGGEKRTYVLNLNSEKFHDPSCSSAAKIAEHNYEEIYESREALIAMGYSPCGNCRP